MTEMILGERDIECEIEQQSCHCVLRSIIVLFTLLVTVGGNETWAQTDYSGTYYIASDYQTKNTTNRNYNPTTLTDNFYLCPTENWISFNASGATKDTWTTGDAKPFLTTYKINNHNDYDKTKAKWTVEYYTSDGGKDYYYIKHNSGKYLVLNKQIDGATGTNNHLRIRLHLENLTSSDLENDTKRDLALYSIARDGRSYIIDPKTQSTFYLTVNKGNGDKLQGENRDGGGTITSGTTYGLAGTLGIYQGNVDDTRYLYLEDVITRPTIEYKGNQIEITAAQTGEGISIKYTTDDSTPTAEHGETYSGPFVPAEGVTTIKAVTIVGGEVSNVATYTILVPCGNTHKYLFQSQNNAWDTDKYHFYMVPGDVSNSKRMVNTTSLFRPSMEWYFLGAGVEAGVQYYYIVNNDNSNNSNYLCYDANTVYMDAFGSGGNKFKFKIVESTDAGSFNIIPYAQRNATGNTARYLNKSNGNDKNNTINLDKADQVNSRWKFILPNTLDTRAPFEVSNNEGAHYYKIENVGVSGYFIIPGSPNAVTSDGDTNDMNWYFEEVSAPSTSPVVETGYYHIRNAITGDYLYFTKSKNNDGACLATSNTITEGSEERYLFTWAKTADATANYYIIPKLLKDASLNQISSLRKHDSGTSILTNVTRGAGNYAWTFAATHFCKDPEITQNVDRLVTITCPTPGVNIYYTTDGTNPVVPEAGNDPTSPTVLYSGAFTPDVSIDQIRAIAVRQNDHDAQSAVVTFDLPKYTYHIVNGSKVVAVSSSAIRQAGGTALSGYSSISDEIRIPYISDETITFYSMPGDFNASLLDNEHRITKTPASNANIYITYTTTNLGSKFVKLSGSSPFNLKNSSGQYLYDNGTTVVAETNAETNAKNYVGDDRNYLWYFYGDDPYNIQIKNAGSNKYLTLSGANLGRSDDAVTFILTGQGDGADDSHKTITLKNLANSEIVTLAINTVVLPISYTLIDLNNIVIANQIAYVDAEGFGLPSVWKSPVVDYHYWNADAFVQTTAGTPDEPFVFVDENNDGVPDASEITTATQVTSNNVIYVTYTLKSDISIDLDGRNLLNDPNKGTGTTYMMQFSGGTSFNQEDGKDGVMDATRKAVYPYNNGDCTLYVYGSERWEEQLASGASTRTRWLWYLEPAKNLLDPYHVRVSSYQNQTNYKVDDNTTRNFHSYLWTYKPENYDAVVTGVTNNNPLAHNGQKEDPAVTNLPEGSEYMLLGTSTSNLKLVTFHEIAGGTDNGTYGTRQTVNSFEQYWKNNPTVQSKLTTEVTQLGRNVELSSDQKTQLPTGWHVYKAWANSQPWVNNNDGGPGKAPTTSKKFLNEEHVFQTIEMGESFQLVPTEIKPMLILLDQHGWEIVRLPLPSGDPTTLTSEQKIERKKRYDAIHKYSSPMVARYHYWKTGSKVPGYHKFKVSDYATVSATDDTEYTTEELGVLIGDQGNLPPYNSQALVSGKERDWYITYDVKSQYASTYAGAATAGETSAAPFLIKQGGRYAQINGTSLSSTDQEPSLESVPTDMQWYLRPNFDIDEEMGYIYAGNPGAEEEAKSKDETEYDDYVDANRLTPYWSNGFDPYNIQIQSVSNTDRYFTANTSGSAVTSFWTGSSSSITLENMGEKDSQKGVVGLDQTNMKITNATFMVVDDGNGNMRLMPRFDHTKVMQTFTTLETQADAADKGDKGTGNQTLYLTMVPKVVEKSSEINAMGGHYMLASNFTASGSIGTKTAPFKGIIEGQINKSFNVSDPFIAYAEDAIIKNVIIENSSVSSGNDDGHASAIVATASGNTRIYNCGVNDGTISGMNHVGGIVGHLDGNARVINCYSYATIEGGSDKGGIVGYNTYKSKASDIRTMVMNCMFYGDIKSGGNISPVYGGEIIENLRGTGNDTHGLNNFNYYAYDELKTGSINKYNCALAMEERYLKRFEFYRQLLNSNKKLAAIYASSPTATVNPEDMMKWVLETADRTIAEPKPYPVLKAQGYYPSIINYDTRDLANYSEENRNKGLKTGELTVNISIGSGYPTGAEIKSGKSQITLIRTDKDFDHYNYNYDKVQLPYYNDVGTKNYTGGKVVTGWKITGFTGGTAGTYTAADQWNGYNFADRNCTNKDKYDVSKRVFSQGAYFDVPYGVTGITIEPYWGNAAFVADACYDVIYDGNYGRQNVTQLEGQVTSTTTFNGVSVKTDINAALGTITSPGSTVYDNAIVLVGNFHQNIINGIEPFKSSNTPFTIMSVDSDNDHEPDYSLIFHDNARSRVNPIRFDFLNIPGTAQVQKPNGTGTILNAAVFDASAWFEITNTCLIYFSQFEYENNVNKTSGVSPIILQGGVFDQFVSTKVSKPESTTYLHVGGNAWFKEFSNGTHSDGNKSTKHIPISVTGGEYKGFYLTGTYNADAAIYNNNGYDNAECYISGGHFEELAGAGQEQIGGNVQWQIYDADIDNFFGGGINENKPILGDITTDIYNSHVGTFCGGPKFGNMYANEAGTIKKIVTTNATGCTFDKYFGAGYGGNSVSRKKYFDSNKDINWTTLQNKYATGDKGKYYNGETTYADKGHTDYGYKGKGVATDFDYEFFVWTGGSTGARLFVKFTSFSLAQCNDVKSTLTGCTINQSFYGGGNLGNVTGTATSVLDGCTVNGNVFGGGYSATLPLIKVRNGGFEANKNPNFNSTSGMFEPGTFSGTTDYEWKHIDNMPSEGGPGTVKIDDKNYIYTDADLTALGQVGATVLTIKGNTKVSGVVEGETTGGVFGGGDMSAINGNTQVNIEATHADGVVNVYGGGNTANVTGNTQVDMTGGKVSHSVYGGGKGQTTTVGGSVIVNIGAKNGEGALSGNGTVSENVYGGSALGMVNTSDTGTPTTNVNIYAGTINGSIFGGGLGHDDEDNTKDIVAQNQGNTIVNVEGGTVKTAVYGGSNENGVLKKKSIVTITGGTVGTLPEGDNPKHDVVFGGGYGAPTLVEGNVELNIGTSGQTTNGATINGNVYGGGALGNTNEEWVTDTSTEPATTKLQPVANTETLVNLFKGTIYGDAYGGGLGNATTPAYVGGDVTVTLDGAKIPGQIFGCNNVNGTPKGKVKVHVKRTVDSAKPTDDGATPTPNPIDRTARTNYDVAAVYGGGNKADYNPTKATGSDSEKEEAYTEVIIEGCEATSIDAVYGGGNAAAVPATKVTIKGSYIINTIYGGGNGAGEGNPGANVGIYDNSGTPTDYGTGKAETKLLGGYINNVYGGSNTKGDVRGGTDVRTRGKNTPAGPDCCTELKVGEIYGAGSLADVNSDVNIVLECMPKDFVDAVYGGAKNATINGNVSLTVTSGKFGRVFGGNNEGGDIRGSIQVNVSEDGCKPLMIGELYGGGNAAPYSIYGCTEGTPWTPNTEGTPYFEGNPENRVDIEVNVYSCTSIGKVFGGGMGSTAKVIGNTRVYINPMKGIVNGTTQDNVGKIGQVFGGGGEADVKGNTRLDIGTALANEPNGVRIESGNDYLSPTANENISITAGVYGGGYSADVDGDATLNIGTMNLPLGVNITGNIFGGGFGESTHVTGDVVVNIGKRTVTNQEGPVYAYEGYANITGDVYGGSAKGKVNSSLVNNVETATEGKSTQVNLYGGTISGNLYGGGLGESTHAADVFGAVTVNVKGGSAYNVFGCNNVNGTPKSDVTVNIDGGDISQSVYGGGNMAIMDGSPVVNVTAGTIGTENEGGAVYGNVYGGGLGSDGTGSQPDLEKIMAGLVKGNTTINISGGTILHNIYGGGAYGSVGTFTYDNTTSLPTALATANTGKATINITGGTIGTNGHNNGMVFGSSRGDIDAIGAIHDKLAWVYDTEVNIGTVNDQTAGPQINGSLYGGGENGHVFNDAAVTMYSGTVGNMEEYYSYRGNVYGGGCGTDLYYSDPSLITGTHTAHDGEGDKYNPKAGIVGHDAKVEIKGGSVANNIYGAGSMGKVGGSTSVTIDTDGAVGVDGNHDDGNVYGAARGELNLAGKIVGNPDDYSSVTNSSVTIKNGTVKGSVFGGGKAGIVKGNVGVTVSGGEVKNDVYGGGALANTNTDNWNTAGSDTEYEEVTGLATETYRVIEMVIGASVTGLYTKDSGTGNYVDATGTAAEDVVYYEKLNGVPVAGYYTKSEDVYERITNSTTTANGETKYYKKVVKGTWANGKNDPSTGTTYKTTVSLTGGLVGNVYGGGLGNSTTAANVYGDVSVKINEGVTDPTKGVAFIQQIENPTIGGTIYPTPVSGRVFGCNNHNGTPTGNVTVHVYSTRQLDNDNNILPGHGSSDRKYSYEIQSVYGGGNQADYMPADGKKSHVIIDGCNETSIEKVYGGGNSAVVPETDVQINGAYDIGYAFGGGNGDKPIKKADGNWYENQGAIVIGLASIVCQGGKIGQVFGGGDAKGSCGNTNAVTKQLEGEGSCPLHITRLYGAGNRGDVSSVNIVLAACSDKAIDYVHGGSYNAHVHGDVHLTITSGILKNVYGGNDARGGIEGNIIVDIEETNGCNPIIIQNLVGGGNEAPFPGTKTNDQGVEVPIGTHGHITVNVKSATRIDNIYGGSFMAEADADTEVNINMIKGSKAGQQNVSIPQEFSYIPNISNKTTPSGGTITCTINDAIGTIGNVYGGGNMGLVKGNATVNIGASDKIQIMARNNGKILDENDNELDIEDGKNVTATIKYTDKTPLGAHITGDVFGGGRESNVTGNTFVNICATPDTHAAVAEGTEKVTIAESVYGGGSLADVLGNTNITMAGGYVVDGVYGGGLQGSVGIAAVDEEGKTLSGAIVYHTGTETHTGCIGKIVNYKENTGKCTVAISGGQIGPVEAAFTDGGMKNTGNHHMDVGASAEHNPVDVGFVFGAGRGEVENPDTDPDADFRTYVKETDVTISGGIVMASVYGGGENGRVRGNTKVTISGGQIGCGEGQVTGTGTAADPYKPKIHTPEEWAGEDPSNFSDCASWDYGEVVGGKTVYLPYDPLADVPYRDGSTVTNGSTTGSDGHTYYGYVFGGGSGYFPYEIKNAAGNVIGHDWLPSAGLVEGNTKVEITGGHILTNVYGGNELTSVKGDCEVIMSGGTLGVPRSNEDILKKPVTCYLFGGGKGDQREHFKMYTNVRNTKVEVKGSARIFGSVFGGAEDGHVSGNAVVNISGTAKIGMSGTSYVDGNVFGGGRGFSGTELTAGTVRGNAEITVSGNPTILGSVYGGGRLASVGVDFAGAQDATTGQFVNDDGDNKYGHVTINISGGTIGNTFEAPVPEGAKYSGNVFGGAMGRLTLLDGSPNELWSRMAQVKTSSVNITGGTIKRNVYGGAEFGTTRDHVYVTIGGSRNESTGAISDSGTPVVNGSVYGGGYGSAEHRAEYNSTITAGSGENAVTYLFTPLQYAGCIGGNTYVNVVGSGRVNGSVYGGGELASVGVIDYQVDANNQYTQVIKHDTYNADKKTFYDFGLSWPYEFKYVAGIDGGKAHVNITGSAIVDNYVFGGGKGQVSFNNVDDITEQRYTEAHIANVKESEVTIGTSGGSVSTLTPTISKSVYGGGEDGHVYENTKVTMHHGTITNSLFGGGKGISTYTTTLWNPDDAGKPKAATEAAHSWTAGKVYGNTEVIMNGGKVGWFIYGGGNMASVGKGNYSGGSDDYSTAGYGELPSADGAIWTATPAAGTHAHYFQNSGKTTVTIMGGDVGSTNAGFDSNDLIPYGSVFGGSRGQAAAECRLSPRYMYVPDFFLGYVNKAYINIGGYKTGEVTTFSANTPNIYGSVYGGSQDGHVRNSTEVKIFKGNISGQSTDTYARSGHVFGAGSGIGKYTDGVNEYRNNASGSVTCTTSVDVLGGTIAGNVYGGGALASVGPPKIGQDKNEQKEKTESSDHASYSCNIVNIKGGSIGGNVFGAGRGPGSSFLTSAFTGGVSTTETGPTYYNPATYATSLWTEVNVTGGTIANNVYGGGEMGQVKESTVVNLTGGKVTHDVYGGGMGTRGDNAIEANVLGNTTVELNKGVADNKTGCVVDKIFGCNDLNGSPKGHVTVHVYATQKNGQDNVSTKAALPPSYSAEKASGEGYKAWLTRLVGEATKSGGLANDADAITAANTLLTNLSSTTEENLTDANKTDITNKANAIDVAMDNLYNSYGYDVTAVYGGGDLAPYEPNSDAEKTEVIIEGCGTTSIKQVYGGGNAAPVSATDVTVKSCFIIDELFGGGNGKDKYQIGTTWYENPGANVGYRQFSHYVESSDDGYAAATHGTGAEGTPYKAIDNADATTPEERRATYVYGTGVAATNINGGHIHKADGGSN